MKSNNEMHFLKLTLSVNTSSSTQKDIIMNTPGGYISGRRDALGKVVVCLMWWNEFLYYLECGVFEHESGLVGGSQNASLMRHF